MTITISNHINDYWLTNNIIDCSSYVETIDIFDEEKLNNNYNYTISENINESKNRSSKPNRECSERHNTEYYNGRYSNRKKISNNRKYDTQETNQHFNIHKNSNTSNSKRKMYTMSKIG